MGLEGAESSCSAQEGITQLPPPPQEAMQQQVDAHPEKADPISSTVTVSSPFVLTAGDVLSLAGLISAANTKGEISHGCVGTSRGVGRGADCSQQRADGRLVHEEQ